MMQAKKTFLLLFLLPQCFFLNGASDPLEDYRASNILLKKIPAVKDARAATSFADYVLNKTFKKKDSLVASAEQSPFLDHMIGSVASFRKPDIFSIDRLRKLKYAILFAPEQIPNVLREISPYVHSEHYDFFIEIVEEIVKNMTQQNITVDDQTLLNYYIKSIYADFCKFLNTEFTSDAKYKDRPRFTSDNLIDLYKTILSQKTREFIQKFYEDKDGTGNPIGLKHDPRFKDFLYTTYTSYGSPNNITTEHDTHIKKIQTLLQGTFSKKTNPVTGDPGVDTLLNEIEKGAQSPTGATLITANTKLAQTCKAEYKRLENSFVARVDHCIDLIIGPGNKEALNEHLESLKKGIYAAPQKLPLELQLNIEAQKAMQNIRAVWMNEDLDLLNHAITPGNNVEQKALDTLKIFIRKNGSTKENIIAYIDSIKDISHACKLAIKKQFNLAEASLIERTKANIAEILVDVKVLEDFKNQVIENGFENSRPTLSKESELVKDKNIKAALISINTFLDETEKTQLNTFIDGLKNPDSLPSIQRLWNNPFELIFNILVVEYSPEERQALAGLLELFDLPAIFNSNPETTRKHLKMVKDKIEKATPTLSVMILRSIESAATLFQKYAEKEAEQDAFIKVACIALNGQVAKIIKTEIDNIQDKNNPKDPGLALYDTMNGLRTIFKSNEAQILLDKLLKNPASRQNVEFVIQFALSDMWKIIDLVLGTYQASSEMNEAYTRIYDDNNSWSAFFDKILDEGDSENPGLIELYYQIKKGQLRSDTLVKKAELQEHDDIMDYSIMAKELAKKALTADESKYLAFFENFDEYKEYRKKLRSFYEKYRETYRKDSKINVEDFDDTIDEIRALQFKNAVEMLLAGDIDVEIPLCPEFATEAIAIRNKHIEQKRSLLDPQVAQLLQLLKWTPGEDSITGEILTNLSIEHLIHTTDESIINFYLSAKPEHTVLKEYTYEIETLNEAIKNYRNDKNEDNLFAILKQAEELSIKIKTHHFKDSDATEVEELSIATILSGIQVHKGQIEHGADLLLKDGLEKILAGNPYVTIPGGTQDGIFALLKNGIGMITGSSRNAVFKRHAKTIETIKKKLAQQYEFLQDTEIANFLKNLEFDETQETIHIIENATHPVLQKYKTEVENVKTALAEFEKHKNPFDTLKQIKKDALFIAISNLQKAIRTHYLQDCFDNMKKIITEIQDKDFHPDLIKDLDELEKIKEIAIACEQREIASIDTKELLLKHKHNLLFSNLERQSLAILKETESVVSWCEKENISFDTFLDKQKQVDLRNVLLEMQKLIPYSESKKYFTSHTAEQCLELAREYYALQDAKTDIKAMLERVKNGIITIKHYKQFNDKHLTAGQITEKNTLINAYDTATGTPKKIQAKQATCLKDLASLLNTRLNFINEQEQTYLSMKSKFRKPEERTNIDKIFKKYKALKDATLDVTPCVQEIDDLTKSYTSYDQWTISKNILDLIQLHPDVFHPADATLLSLLIKEQESIDPQGEGAAGRRQELNDMCFQLCINLRNRVEDTKAYKPELLGSSVDAINNYIETHKNIFAIRRTKQMLEDCQVAMRAAQPQDAKITKEELKKRQWHLVKKKGFCSSSLDLFLQKFEGACSSMTPGVGFSDRGIQYLKRLLPYVLNSCKVNFDKRYNLQFSRDFAIAHKLAKKEPLSVDEQIIYQKEKQYFGTYAGEEGKGSTGLVAYIAINKGTQQTLVNEIRKIKHRKIFDLLWQDRQSAIDKAKNWFLTMIGQGQPLAYVPRTEFSMQNIQEIIDLLELFKVVDEHGNIQVKIKDYDYANVLKHLKSKTTPVNNDDPALAHFILSSKVAVNPAEHIPPAIGISEQDKYAAVLMEQADARKVNTWGFADTFFDGRNGEILERVAKIIENYKPSNCKIQDRYSHIPSTEDTTFTGFLDDYVNNAVVQGLVEWYVPDYKPVFDLIFNNASTLKEIYDLMPEDRDSEVSSVERFIDEVCNGNKPTATKELDDFKQSQQAKEKTLEEKYRKNKEKYTHLIPANNTPFPMLEVQITENIAAGVTPYDLKKIFYDLSRGYAESALDSEIDTYKKEQIKETLLKDKARLLHYLKNISPVVRRKLKRHVKSGGEKHKRELAIIDDRPKQKASLFKRLFFKEKAERAPSKASSVNTLRNYFDGNLTPIVNHPLQGPTLLALLKKTLFNAVIDTIEEHVVGQSTGLQTYHRVGNEYAYNDHVVVTPTNLTVLSGLMTILDAKLTLLFSKGQTLSKRTWDFARNGELERQLKESTQWIPQSVRSLASGLISTFRPDKLFMAIVPEEVLLASGWKGHLVAEYVLSNTLFELANGIVEYVLFDKLSAHQLSLYFQKHINELEEILLEHQAATKDNDKAAIAYAEYRFSKFIERSKIAPVSDKTIMKQLPRFWLSYNLIHRVFYNQKSIEFLHTILGIYQGGKYKVPQSVLNGGFLATALGLWYWMWRDVGNMYETCNNAR